MNDKEKQAAQEMANAIANLPEEKKQYFIGFAEGVTAALAPTEKGETK